MTVSLPDPKAPSARLHVIRERHLDGLTTPGIEDFLDQHVPEWRQDPSDIRWHREADDYEGWWDERGFVPEVDTAGAAGFRVWADRQGPETTTPSQLRRLEGMRGVQSTLADPAAAPAWSLAAALLDAGAISPRIEDRRGGEWQAREWLARGGTAATVDVSSLSAEELGRMFGIALHLARYGRLPACHEPHGTWLAHRRSGGTTPGAWADANLAPLVRTALSPTWRRGRERVVRFIQANGRRPSQYATGHEERYCAGWIKAARKAVAAGKIDAAELPDLDA